MQTGVVEQMISIVCVYNNAQVLRERLLHSLDQQAVSYELIDVDNRQSRFQSAAAALNWGAAQARGDWLLFAHQDVALLSDEWLARAERLLNELNPVGWCGVAGSDQTGRSRGMLLDRAHLSGEPIATPLEIQTLDECVLIHRRAGDRNGYFDEGLTGWHAYGVEACCAAIREGAKNYVLPLPVWHDSKTTNLAGLEEAHQYVWQKHGGALKRIATTCGNLPDEYGWGNSANCSLKRMWSRIETSY
ncbi:MAG TPA: glycosyltransferase family 2 protein, partial [Pyrinomonadaceae bacterium]|nr:glycosyltransferase family 2 protein [Pyrinomonadaceae bacterium]